MRGLSGSRTCLSWQTSCRRRHGTQYLGAHTAKPWLGTVRQPGHRIYPALSCGNSLGLWRLTTARAGALLGIAQLAACVICVMRPLAALLTQPYFLQARVKRPAPGWVVNIDGEGTLSLTSLV